MSHLSELSHIQQRLRRDDYAAYLSVKRVPAALQEPLFWLEGFFKEVSDIPYRVDEPFLAEIRLQWWRDGIDKILRGERLGHPIADGLAPYLLEHEAALKGPLVSILNSFETEVMLSAVDGKDAFFERYKKRFGAVLAARFLLAGEGEVDLALLEEAGIAIGVSDMLATLPQALTKGFPLLPQVVLDQFDLTYEDLVKAEEAPRLTRFYQEVVTGATVISWDIKGRISPLSALQKKLLARWILVPGVLRCALAERVAGKMTMSSQSPLSQFYRLLLLRP